MSQFAILLAPDKFKDCLSARAVARAMREGVLIAAPHAEVERCPIADGGEGTVRILRAALGGESRSTIVTGPLGMPVRAEWARLADGSAVVESASAAGYSLVAAADRNPMHTTTFGVGELVRAALDDGATRIVVGLGGTVTNDAGAGFLQALGAHLVPGPKPFTGAHLSALTRVDFTHLDPRLAHVELIAACDVDNPLFGPQGAAHTFAPQKGASPAEVIELDRGLRRISALALEAGHDSAAGIGGTGAAGGLGFALYVCGARLVSGAELILDYTGFSARLEHADLVLTAEGQLDLQSLSGKAVRAVARRARESGKPVVALSGAERLDPERAWAAGFAAVFSICNGPMTLEDAKNSAPRLIAQRTAQIVKLWTTARAGAIEIATDPPLL